MATGTYVLVQAGAHQLPIIFSPTVPGEGATIHSARLELVRDGQLRGQVIVSLTDSTTVTDTILVEGRWEGSGDSVRVSYQWSRPRWHGGPREFLPGPPISGTVDRRELTLSELAFLNAQLFGSWTPLRFRRVH